MKDRLSRPGAAEALVEAKRLKLERSRPDGETRLERTTTARLLIQAQRLVHTDRHRDD